MREPSTRSHTLELARETRTESTGPTQTALYPPACPCLLLPLIKCAVSSAFLLPGRLPELTIASRRRCPRDRTRWCRQIHLLRLPHHPRPVSRTNSSPLQPRPGSRQVRVPAESRYQGLGQLGGGHGGSRVGAEWRTRLLLRVRFSRFVLSFACTDARLPYQIPHGEP